MPNSATSNAEKAFAEHTSVVGLVGDVSSHAEGIICSPDLDIYIPFKIEHGNHPPSMVLLPPGDWVIVSRVVPELSEPQDEYHRELKNVHGLYAATFFRLPDESRALELQLTLPP